MNNRLSRRDVMAAGALAIGGAGVAKGGTARTPGVSLGQPEEEEPDSGVVAKTIREAQKLIGIEFTAEEREGIARGFGRSVRGYERRRERTLDNGLGPAMVFDAREAAGEVRVLTPAAPTDGDVRVLTPAALAAGEVRVLTPAAPTDGDVRVLTPAALAAGEVRVLTPAAPTDGDVRTGGTPVPLRAEEDAAEFVRSADRRVDLPSDDEDIAFAPVTDLSRWIERGELSSERLTKIYLKRLKKYGPKLECVITLTEELALSQARRADEEIRSGKYRGPLHGIPWGAKDLFDTKGIATTWGAMPYKDRVAEDDAVVVRKLEEAGAVLVAKTTLGALAYGDIWFGGKTRNPWDLDQGSSGSSAGSASGTAAGLFGFSLGTETLGSIVSPTMRCGVTGLRPTFGRVARTGAMALCWSLDKVGAICRGVEDCVLVLDAIRGSDAGDASSVDEPLAFDAGAPLDELRVGIVPAWFDGRGANDIDRAALKALRKTGVQIVEIEMPEMNPGPMRTILNVEAAAAFEELTLSGRDDELVWQEPRAWPTSFRKAWFTPAIELVQAERIRRQICVQMAGVFDGLDAMFGPSFAGGMLLITNNTGHPSVTLKAGITERGRPHGVTLWGGLFDEGVICRVGMALEAELGVRDMRPQAYMA